MQSQAILTQVNGDAVRSAQFGKHGGGHGIGFGGQAGLPNGGDVVNIHSEADHGVFPWVRAR